VLAGLLDGLELHPRVTYLIGENGTGKSTFIEGIAACAGFGEHGGSKFLRSDTPDWSPMSIAMRLIRGTKRERDGFFLRAESFYNVGSRIEELAKDDGRILASYGGTRPHSQSHGEWFLSVITNRLTGGGLYILDEPESGLSPTRQFAFLVWLRRQAEKQGSQLIIATHSPILLAYPNATIYELSESGIDRVEYEGTDHFLLTRDFLNAREHFLRELFTDA
jgi:predicted ATPase